MDNRISHKKSILNLNPQEWNVDMPVARPIKPVAPPPPPVPVQPPQQKGKKSDATILLTGYSNIPDGNKKVDGPVDFASLAGIPAGYNNDEPEKKKGKGIFVVIAIILALIVGAGIYAAMSLCSDCQKAFATVTYTDADGISRDVCDSCYNRELDKKCDNCNENIENGVKKSYEANNVTYNVCEKCFDEYTCDSCEKYDEKFVAYTDEKGNQLIVCNDCYSKATCSQCEKYVPEDQRKVLYGDGTESQMMCKDCYKIATFTCEDCNEPLNPSVAVTYVGEHGITRKVCADCKNEATCDDCKTYFGTQGKYFYEDNSYKTHEVCYDCYNNHTCDDCLEYVENNSFRMYEDEYGNEHFVCEKCSDEYFTVYCYHCGVSINTSETDNFYHEYEYWENYYYCSTCYYLYEY